MGMATAETPRKGKNTRRRSRVKGSPSPSGAPAAAAPQARAVKARSGRKYDGSLTNLDLDPELGLALHLLILLAFSPQRSACVQLKWTGLAWLGGSWARAHENSYAYTRISFGMGAMAATGAIGSTPRSRSSRDAALHASQGGSKTSEGERRERETVERILLGPPLFPAPSFIHSFVVRLPTYLPTYLSINRKVPSIPLSSALFYNFQDRNKNPLPHF
jgi:hypothetical protein